VRVTDGLESAQCLALTGVDLERSSVGLGTVQLALARNSAADDKAVLVNECRSVRGGCQGGIRQDSAGLVQFAAKA
jgi:hypothetical protein